jgi:exocyst complex component 4
MEITSSRTALLEAKECLGSKRADLVQLWNRGHLLEEMLKILDQMYAYFLKILLQVKPMLCCSEHLKTVPDLLETLMSEKRLLQASILLIRSLKIINNPDMLEIGAVADLRSYLNNQEVVR